MLDEEDPLMDSDYPGGFAALLSDHIDISMDVYEVTFPDAPPGSIHEKVKSDAPVQYSASLVAKLLGEALPRPVKAVVDKRYELEREQLEEEVAMEDCV